MVTVAIEVIAPVRDSLSLMPEHCDGMRFTAAMLDACARGTGALKNALDVGSRPYGKNNWDNKPGLVMSCSPGNIGAFGANHHLRQSLVFLNVLPLQQPEAYISGVDKLLNDAGDVTKHKSREFLCKIMQAYEAWVNLLAKR